MTWEQLLAVAAIGAGVGLLGGLFGKGGSAVATPLLSLVGIPPIAAVASPLPATIPSTLSATYAYWRERLVDRHVVAWSAAVGIPATVAGAYATRCQVHDHPLHAYGPRWASSSSASCHDRPQSVLTSTCVIGATPDQARPR